MANKLDFDIPDVSEEARKAAVGHKQRKPRRAGELRLMGTMRDISRHFTATREGFDEEKETEFYSLSEGKSEILFYGLQAELIGVCMRKKKTAIIYMEVKREERDSLIKALTEKEGKPVATDRLDLFADTVTTIIVTRPEKGDSVFTVALADSGEAKALSDNAAVEEEAALRKRGFLSYLWNSYFYPVGRISQRSYIPKFLTMVIPTLVLFYFSVEMPEIFEGEANMDAVAFMLIGTLCFVSLLSLGMRRMSDIGLSHLWYWVFFGILFAFYEMGPKYMDKLLIVRIITVIFLAACAVLSFIPGDPKKNKYGPVPKR
jgi:uncharacterized membrane protein YhaH (DUF805 family)